MTLLNFILLTFVIFSFIEQPLMAVSLKEQLAKAPNLDGLIAAIENIFNEMEQKTNDTIIAALHKGNLSFQNISKELSGIRNSINQLLVQVDLQEDMIECLMGMANGNLQAANASFIKGNTAKCAKFMKIQKPEQSCTSTTSRPPTTYPPPDPTTFPPDPITYPPPSPTDYETYPPIDTTEYETYPPPFSTNYETYPPPSPTDYETYSAGPISTPPSNAGNCSHLLHFDDMSANYDDGILIPSGYKLFNWSSNAAIIDPLKAAPNSGYYFGLRSSPNVMFNGYGNLSSMSRSSNFGVCSLFVTAAWEDRLTAVFEGYLRGVSVARHSVVLNVSDKKPTYVHFPEPFANIDRFTFVGTGGVSNSEFIGFGKHLAIDNLSYDGFGKYEDETANKHRYQNLVGSNDHSILSNGHPK